MIDFHNFERLTLEDVADFERAKKDYIYPAGTSTLQISATRGQIGFLEQNGTVKSKDVAIIPISGVNPRYLNIVLHKNIAEFMRKYATGINIQEKEVGRFPIELHNPETQDAIVKIIQTYDDEEERIKRDINNLKDFKQTMLDQLLI